MNICSLVGNITRDIEVKYTNSNKAVANSTIAVRRKFKNQSGEYESDFINFVAWGKTAELISEYFTKGDRIGITGSIQTRNYENNNGQRVYVTEVVVSDIDFLQQKREEQTIVNNQQVDNEPFGNDSSIDISDDDLPF